MGNETDTSSTVPVGGEEREPHSVGPEPGPERAASSVTARALEWVRSLPRLEAQLLLILALLYLAFTIAEPDIFPTQETLENLARQAGVLLAVTVGQMIVLVVGGFDISVAANMGFTSTVLALLVDDLGLAGAVAAAIALGGVVGLINGIVISKFRVNPFVATLAMLTFLTGLSNQLSHGASVGITNPGIRDFGAADWGPIPGTMGIGLIIVLVAYVLLNRLRPGLYIYAIGGSRETARLSGISVGRYEILAYVVCGLFASVAGVMLASRVTLGQASLGAGFELQSIAAAVIGGAAIGGGVGRLLGAVVGVAILTVLTSGLEIVGVSEFARQMVTGGVLVAAVIFNQRRRLTEWAVPQKILSRLRATRGSPASTPAEDPDSQTPTRT
jgi:ribose/xylose/arabinose/galactoside ABC-type transport system permease subunit